MAASFHAYVCMLQWLGCMSGFIFGLTSMGREDLPWLWYTSLIGLFAMPIVNELFLCLKGRICKKRVELPDKDKLRRLNDCIPIVYSPGYNIHAFGVEKLHPFDAAKYRRIFADLVESGTLKPDNV